MGKRGIHRTGVKFAPIDRDLTEGIKHPLADTCFILQKYLNDEFELVDEFTLTERSFRLKNFSALNDVQALMVSVRIIGERIIRKYCKNKTPHYIRYAIWKKGLLIAQMFESENVVRLIENRYYIYRNYIFLCRVYDVDGLGVMVIPENKPIPLSDWDSNCGSCFFDMPAMLIHGKEMKKHAATLIAEFNPDIKL